MQIAVVGGGPGGCWSAVGLAKRGHDVTLFDPQTPWEKPCGGGITTRALDRFGIFAGDLPRKNVDQITLSFGNRTPFTFAPGHPLTVVSRKELGAYLLAEVQKAGVRHLPDRVSQLVRDGEKWQIRTKRAEFTSDFVIGADGATSFVRRTVGTALPPEDLCITLGYFVPINIPSTMKVFFVPTLEGYIWSFPRPNHVSYGLISRSGPGRTARGKELLYNFVSADLGHSVTEISEFYSAPVPCLRYDSWKTNVISGKGWALVGDAAGLVDPLTGEGIYFAFRSAEILIDSMDRPEEYQGAIWNEIGRELARAAHMYPRFYNGRFLGGDFRDRAIQMARRSRTLRQLMGNFVSGNVSYLNLKKRLFLSIPSVGWDLVRRRQ